VAMDFGFINKCRGFSNTFLLLSRLTFRPFMCDVTIGN
jgi:hypothetical protein